MRADFKLLPRLLVHVRRTQHTVLVLHRGQRDWSRYVGASPLHRLHDFAGGLVQHPVVIRLEANPNSLFSVHVSSASSAPPLPAAEGKNLRRAVCRLVSASSF